jgi:hypothetical protein
LQLSGNALTDRAPSRFCVFEPTRRCKGESKLADKCTEGELTPEERDEYEGMIRVGNFVAILQAKARRLLAEGHPARWTSSSGKPSVNVPIIAANTAAFLKTQMPFFVYHVEHIVARQHGGSDDNEVDPFSGNKMREKDFSRIAFGRRRCRYSLR